MNKKLINIIQLFALTAFVLLIGGTVAYWRIDGETSTQVKTGQVKGNIILEYEAGTPLYPGTSLNHVVGVRNSGQLDMVARLKVDIGWQNQDLEDEMLTVVYNDQYWLAGEDGYFYYKGIIEPGQTTEGSLLESFGLDTAAGNEYSGQAGDFNVSLECLQASANALQVWNKSYNDLGIAEPKQVETVQSEVVFTSAKNFEFSSKGVAVLPTFENMAPGETRTQTMRLTNQYSDSLAFFLKPSIPEDGNQELFKKMLSEYAVLTLTGEDGTQLYKGPVLNASEEIDLGMLKANTEKTMIATLSLDSKMGNEYQSLLGQIEWSFIAQSTTEGDGGGGGGTDGTGTGGTGSSSTGNGKVGSGTTGIPKTGDDVSAKLIKSLVMLLLLAILVAVYCFYLEKKKRRRAGE